MSVKPARQEITFVPVRQHAANIARILEARYDPSRWFGVCEWLIVAASVGEVELNTIQYNVSYGYCSTADEYEEAREQVLKGFVQEYSVFSFIWGALEGAIDLITPPETYRARQKGKGSRCCISSP